MLPELLLAIGLPLALLLTLVLALEHGGDSLPPWLQRLSESPLLLWNVGIGLIISLSLSCWLLSRSRFLVNVVGCQIGFVGAPPPLGKLMLGGLDQVALGLALAGAIGRGP